MKTFIKHAENTNAPDANRKIQKGFYKTRLCPFFVNVGSKGIMHTRQLLQVRS